MNRGDYGPAPTSAPTKVPTSARGVQVSGPKLGKAKSGPAMPSQSYGTAMGAKIGSTTGRAPGAGIVTYSSKVTKK